MLAALKNDVKDVKKTTCFASSHQSKLCILQQSRNEKLNNSVVGRSCCEQERRVLRFP